MTIRMTTSISVLAALIAVSFAGTSARAADMAIKLPKQIVCDGAQLETGLADVRFLSEVVENRVGKTATSDGDYTSAAIDRAEYTFRSWTCDSWDYDYAFATNDLIEPATSNVAEKHVSARVHAEVRDADQGTKTQDCVARY